MRQARRLSAGARIAWLSLAGTFLLCGRSAHAQNVEVYDVDAWIDTTDYLYIQGTTFQWEHKTSGSPAGTHGGPEPTVITTSLNGTMEMNGYDWNQTWPDPLPSDAFSSVLASLNPELPLTGTLIGTVSNISGRGTPSIYQEPSAANGDTLIVQFSDGADGAAYLDAQITVVPEPASIGLIGLGAVCLLGARPRRGTGK